MQKCGICGFENEDTDVYCKDCGSKLGQVIAPTAPVQAAPSPAPAPAPALDPVAAPVQAVQTPTPDPAAAPPAAMITCPSCGTANEPDFKFCKGCGVSLSVPAAQPAPAPVAPPAAPDMSAAPVAPPAPDPTLSAAPVAPSPAPTPAPAPAATGPRMVVVSEPGNGTVYMLAEPSMAVGRVPDGNDITLSTDNYVSSHHAVITQEGNDFFIEDLGSTNGTFQLLKGKVKLQPGVVIKMGDTNLEFQV